MNLCFSRMHIQSLNLVYVQNIKAMNYFSLSISCLLCMSDWLSFFLEKILRWLLLSNIEFLVRSYPGWLWDETMYDPFCAPFLKRLGISLFNLVEDISETSLLNELLSILKCRFLVTNLLSLDYEVLLGLRSSVIVCFDC